MISWKSLSSLEEQIPSINKGRMMQSQAEIDCFCCLKLSSFPFAEGKPGWAVKEVTGCFCFHFPYYYFSIKFNDRWSFVDHPHFGQALDSVESGRDLAVFPDFEEWSYLQPTVAGAVTEPCSGLLREQRRECPIVSPVWILLHLPYSKVKLKQSRGWREADVVSGNTIDKPARKRGQHLHSCRV